MRPHLVRWANEYKDRGLVIIDIDNGQIDARNQERVWADAKEAPFRTIWDVGGKICTTYGIRGYPAAFLIGVDGTVIWEGFPLPAAADLEAKIKAELEKVAEEHRSDPDGEDASGEDGDSDE